MLSSKFLQPKCRLFFPSKGGKSAAGQLVVRPVQPGMMALAGALHAPFASCASAQPAQNVTIKSVFWLQTAVLEAIPKALPAAALPFRAIPHMCGVISNMFGAMESRSGGRRNGSGTLANRLGAVAEVSGQRRGPRGLAGAKSPASPAQTAGPLAIFPTPPPEPLCYPFDD